jgi:hypothetical protein
MSFLVLLQKEGVVREAFPEESMLKTIDSYTLNSGACIHEPKEGSSVRDLTATFLLTPAEHPIRVKYHVNVISDAEAVMPGLMSASASLIGSGRTPCFSR